MANETLKELRYNGQKVVAEVARRDALGKTINRNYLTTPLLIQEDKAIFTNNDTHTFTYNDVYTALKALDTRSYLSAYVTYRITFINLNDNYTPSISINGAVISRVPIALQGAEWNIIEVTMLNNGEIANFDSIVKIYGNDDRQNAYAVAVNIPQYSNSLTISMSGDTSASTYVAVNIEVIGALVRDAQY